MRVLRDQGVAHGFHSPRNTPALALAGRWADIWVAFEDATVFESEVTAEDNLKSVGCDIGRLGTRATNASQIAFVVFVVDYDSYVF